MDGACSPVRGGFDVVQRDDGHALVTMMVLPGEPVFRGHYPGFPIFPGVCVIECVRRGALATIPAPPDRWAMAEIASVRFVSPVFPGDRLTADLGWTHEAGSWWCTATTATQRGITARMKIRFAQRSET